MGGRSGKSLSRLSGKSLGLDLVGERSGQGVVVRGWPVDRRRSHFAAKKTLHKWDNKSNHIYVIAFIIANNPSYHILRLRSV